LLIDEVGETGDNLEELSPVVADVFDSVPVGLGSPEMTETANVVAPVAIKLVVVAGFCVAPLSAAAVDPLPEGVALVTARIQLSAIFMLQLFLCKSQMYPDKLSLRMPRSLLCLPQLCMLALHSLEWHV
jgi:hypothetical protein